MKNLLIILTLLIFASCDDKEEKENHSIIGLGFQDFKQLHQLAGYTKVSDTVIYKNNLDPQHGILHLRNQTNNLVIFKRIFRDAMENKRYKILDTLIIQNPRKPEGITIGYCQLNNDNDENIIAIVEFTSGLEIETIKKAWRANTSSNKIEVVNTVHGINCLNEFFTEEKGLKEN